MTGAVGPLAALGAALLFGLTSALQHVAAGRAARRPPLHPGLLRELLGDRLWLAGTACDGGAVVLQAVALRMAPVLVVQPLLVLGLPFAVLLRSVLSGSDRARRRPGWREVLLSAACAASVSIFVTVVEPHGGGALPGTVPLLVVAALLAGAALLPRLLRGERAVALLSAAAAGVGLGLGSVALRAVAIGWGHDRPARLVPLVVLLVAAGTVGLLATQAAFQYGPLAAPLALLTMAEPAVAAVGAYALLGERLSLDGPRLTATCLSGGLCLVTVVLLARSAPPARVHA